MSTEIQEKDYCLLSERPKDYIPEIKSLKTLLDEYGEKINNEHKLIMDSLELSVEEYRRKNPEKYELAQIIGNDVMEKIYDVVEGEDTIGNRIRAKELYNIYLDELIDLNDMTIEETNLLDLVYEGKWYEKKINPNDYKKTNSEILSEKNTKDLSLEEKMYKEFYLEFRELTSIDCGWDVNGDYQENIKRQNSFVTKKMEEWRKNK